ncbi:arylsulfatase [Halobacteriales archaeon QS_4_66_20]|nr:MAG: arylsulfatase [Halobacteriales archaeon QS_4_66_20]
MSLYGHHNETTPFLERFAEGATTYTQARAPSTWSLPSHVSMFTGLYPYEHQLNGRDQRLKPGHTIWEDLRDDQDYATAVFSSNPFLTAAPVGLEETFEHSVGMADLPFENAMDPREFVREQGKGAYTAFFREAITSGRPVASLANGVYEKLDRAAPRLLPDAVRNDNSGVRFADKFLEWETEQSGPWAVCVNLMDAHQPYKPAPEYDNWGEEYLHKLQDDIDSIWEFNGGQRPWWQRRALEALYDGSIRQLDAILERIVSRLQRRDVLENTLLIIAGDHGEGFGEPSNIKPGTRAVAHGNGGSHEVLLHVPLVVKIPGQSEGSVDNSVCSLTHLPGLIDSTTGNESENRFPPAEPVVASGYGLNDRMRQNASKFCNDLTPYEGETRVYYENVQNGTVRKRITWKSEEATLEVRDAQTHYRISNSSEGEVESVFATLDQKEVTGKASDVDAEVQQRLEDLGYA